MKMWLITSGLHGWVCVVKAATREEAKRLFERDITTVYLSRLYKDPEYKIRELTLEELSSVTGDQFMIVPEIEF